MKTMNMVWFSKKALFLFSLCFFAMLLIPQYVDYHMSVNGGFTEWSKWSICTATCGQRVRGRTRNCTNPAPKGSGKPCSEIGSYVLVTPCPLINCPINGNWGEWGAWGPCTINCVDGKRTRERKCDNPKPMYGGMNCNIGPASEGGKCDSKLPCPIDGGISNWDNWGVCTKTCGDGTRERKRYCNNPEPKYSGKNCPESLQEGGPCKIKDCVIPTKDIPIIPTAGKPPPKP